jgi:hypothetical protein
VGSYRGGVVRMVVRAGLALLAALNLWWGAWATLAPSQFYATFPGFGHRWTVAYPPYNEHLVTDLGATFLTLGLLLVLATVLAARQVRVVVLGAVLVFNALHLSFHATHRGAMGADDFRASLVALAAGVALPVVLLVVDAVSARARRPRTRAVEHAREWAGVVTPP